MIITTKKGDFGTTTLFNNQKVTKFDKRIKLIGKIDELQALIGLIKLKIHKSKNRLFLEKIQKYLFLIMANLSGARNESKKTVQEWTLELEKEELQLLRHVKIESKFVIPGVNESEANINWLRTVVRLVESEFSELCQQDKGKVIFLPYLNRLSDYLFVLSRFLALS